MGKISELLQLSARVGYHEVKRISLGPGQGPEQKLYMLGTEVLSTNWIVPAKKSAGIDSPRKQLKKYTNGQASQEEHNFGCEKHVQSFHLRPKAVAR